MTKMTQQFSLYFKSKKIQVDLSENETGYLLSSFEKDSIVNNTESVSSSLVDIVEEIPFSLRANKVLIIDSLKSGTGRSDDKDISRSLIEPLFQLLEIEFTLFKTKTARSIEEIAKSLEPVNTTVIFISGDTSITEFINGLGKIQDDFKPVSISIFPIPAGTGNSFALSLGLANQLSAVAQLFKSTQLSPLYLYNLKLPQGSYHLVQNEAKNLINSNMRFIVVFSWAFHASLVADSDTPNLRKYGLKRFQIAAQNNLSRVQEYQGDVIIKSASGREEIIKGPFAYWLLTPAQKFEPTFEISPRGNILENCLYLVAFRTKEEERKKDNSSSGTGNYIMDIMTEVYDGGKHIENPNVIYKKINKGDCVNLLTKNSKELQQRRFCVDGSIIALPETNNHEIEIQVGDNKEEHGWNLYIIH
ncbi:hypothetical protein KGF56_002564 [Candida oxycetoniae]|uniref:DAGKc domain-containing protein n=1 Tax=Candida oxycetoniae TaxID=497107 RepID=A0AAI9WY02_9ASCO|nr:uncharacterized protein KGF56_002564 [Candida oxycetoniae]KAI3404619.2 hypothetical protein KGF56_002564 [Candida oxycetoniae]